MTTKRNRLKRRKGGFSFSFSRKTHTPILNVSEAVGNPISDILDEPLLINTNYNDEYIISNDEDAMEMLNDSKNSYKKHCKSWFSYKKPDCKQHKKNMRVAKNYLKESCRHIPEMVYYDFGGIPDVLASRKAYQMKYNLCCPKGYFGFKNRKRTCRKLDNSITEFDKWIILRGKNNIDEWIKQDTNIRDYMTHRKNIGGKKTRKAKRQNHAK